MITSCTKCASDGDCKHFAVIIAQTTSVDNKGSYNIGTSSRIQTNWTFRKIGELDSYLCEKCQREIYRRKVFHNLGWITLALIALLILFVSLLVYQNPFPPGPIHALIFLAFIVLIPWYFFLKTFMNKIFASKYVECSYKIQDIFLWDIKEKYQVDKVLMHGRIGGGVNQLMLMTGKEWNNLQKRK